MRHASLLIWAFTPHTKGAQKHSTLSYYILFFSFLSFLYSSPPKTIISLHQHTTPDLKSLTHFVAHHQHKSLFPLTNTLLLPFVLYSHRLKAPPSPPLLTTNTSSYPAVTTTPQGCFVTSLNCGLSHSGVLTLLQRWDWDRVPLPPQRRPPPLPSDWHSPTLNLRQFLHSLPRLNPQHLVPATCVQSWLLWLHTLHHLIFNIILRILLHLF